MRLYALFGLAFAAPADVTSLGWPHRLTRRLILQEARRQAGRRIPGFRRDTDAP